MITTEKLKSKIINLYVAWCNNLINSEKYQKETIKLIQQTKSEWCKQQRENCADMFAFEMDYKEIDLEIGLTKEHIDGNNEVRYNILNAPEP